MLKSKLLMLVFLAMFIFTGCEDTTNEEVLGQESIESVESRSLKSVTRYTVKQKYKDAYYHINQYDSKIGNVNYGNCSWSNYIMAVGCVGRASGTIDYYGSDKTNIYDEYKVKRLRDFMYKSRGSYGKAATMEYIYKDYGLIYDANKVGLSWRTTGKSSGYHQTITNELINHLSDFGTPIVIIGGISGAGHYYTVFTIDWTGSRSTSTIYVADSMKGNTGDKLIYPTVQSHNLQTFLDNLSAGSSSAYSRCNMLFTYDLSRN